MKKLTALIAAAALFGATTIAPAVAAISPSDTFQVAAAKKKEKKDKKDKKDKKKMEKKKAGMTLESFDVAAAKKKEKKDKKDKKKMEKKKA